MAIMEARRQWNSIFKVWEENNCQPRIMSSQNYLKKDPEVIIFSERLRKIPTTRRSITLKVILEVFSEKF